MVKSIAVVAAVFCTAAHGVAIEDGKLKANDDPAFDLAPGMRFECDLRLDSLVAPNGCVEIFRKGRTGDRGSMMLRVDRPDEGGRLSLYLNTDGSVEPRIGATGVRTGVWHRVCGGWDGECGYLAIDGRTNRVRRVGNASRNSELFRVMRFAGKLRNLKFADRAMGGNRDMRPEPGFRLKCVAEFEREPDGATTLLKKPGAYWLRYDPVRGGEFNFFMKNGASWEPRTTIRMHAKPNEKYRITAGWDGERVCLHVNGEEARGRRKVNVDAEVGKLEIGCEAVRITGLGMDGAKGAELSIADVRTLEMLPLVAKPATLIGFVRNRGNAETKYAIAAKCLTAGAKLQAVAATGGVVKAGERAAFGWRIDAGTNLGVKVMLQVRAADGTVVERRESVAFMTENAPEIVRETQSYCGKTYYVDSNEGNDEASGLSEASPWRSFSRVNGMKLHPGDRLRLKRGSVFREELRISAGGTVRDRVEIGAYGSGADPVIRRNRFIGDRCMLVQGAEYLTVRDLTVCDAGKGIDMPNARGVIIERCVAHHIEGLYIGNAHGIPEWRDRGGAAGGCAGEGSGGGIALIGARDSIVRDCETYQCSSGFRISGSNLLIRRMHSHDNFCHNTSPHPYLTFTGRVWLEDSVFDAAGWKASAGTMGLMLALNNSLIVRNCHFLNQPDSGSPDEGGIDFESGGRNILLERCTFRNNAGPAIEVLGLDSPQVRNLKVSGCRFYGNNYKLKQGPAPSEFYVWGKVDRERVLCSNGEVTDNGYVLAPGVCFYTNQAVRTRKDWKVSGNRQYASAADLDAAMPYGAPPKVDAGDERWISERKAVLRGRVASDRPVRCRWRQTEGPAAATLIGEDETDCTALFPKAGDYRFALVADDGTFRITARTQVHVAAAVPVKCWNFERNLGDGGWKSEAAGTVREVFPATNGNWRTFSDPVDLACGGYRVLAIRNSAKAALVSPDCGGAKAGAVLVRMQNGTDSAAMRVLVKCTGSGEWMEGGTCALRRCDAGDETYRIELPRDLAIERVKIAFSAASQPITGTVRVDYIALLAR